LVILSILWGELPLGKRGKAPVNEYERKRMHFMAMRSMGRSELANEG